MNQTALLECFLLTRNSRDTRHGFEIELWARSSEGMPVQVVITNFRPLFFVPHAVSGELTTSADERRELPLRAMTGEPVDCCYFRTHAALQQCAQTLKIQPAALYESDIHPVDRYLMERSIAGGFKAEGPAGRNGDHVRMINPRLRGAPVQPALTVLSLDIETNVTSGSLYSIACSGTTDVVFVVGSRPDLPGIVFCRDEKTLLTRFYRHMAQEDPDIIIGWNVVDFDLKFLYERSRNCNLPFTIGRGGSPGTVFPARGGNRSVARIKGRVVIDVPVHLRTYFHTFEEYSLNFVAEALLGKSKEITLTGREKIAEIDRRYRDDIVEFARYNLRDAILTKEIFDTAGILPNAVERSRRSGHLLDRTGGSIAAFDYLYLPRLHRAGYVAADTPAFPSDDTPLPGGYVIEPKPGLYDNVLVLDFRSLYPSIIMSFAIDPLGRYRAAETGDTVRGPAGPRFSRAPAILPGIIAELLEARIEAKKSGNGPLSQAIKILMNSFYGVLGARNCRFFSAELATAITQTGQYLLKTSIRYIEESLGHPVIYGDTDSLFVHLGTGAEADAQATGRDLSCKVTGFLKRHLKERFAAESALLLQFEIHYRYFLIPAVRGTAYGSKKHYCGGTVQDGTLALHFKGMESARSDWTDLAKEFQQELIRRIFTGEPVERFVHRMVDDVTSGRADAKLVYKKRLRKHHDEYTHAVPPHVQAARRLENPPHLIRYCITVDGPQPVERLRSALDYRHYIDCQLQPVADSVLELTGSSFSGILSGQQDLFASPES